MGPPGWVCVLWVEGRLVLVRAVCPGLRGRVVGARAECLGEDDAVRVRGFLYIFLSVSFRTGPSGWRLFSWYMLVLVRAVCPGLCGRGVGARAERLGECDAVRVRGFFYIFLSVSFRTGPSGWRLFPWYMSVGLQQICGIRRRRLRAFLGEKGANGLCRCRGHVRARTPVHVVCAGQG